MKILLSLTLLLCSALAHAQTGPRTMTNADVVEMLKAGLPESTIVLSISQGPSNFDTSPQSLIQLKKEGATPGILDAMLKAGSPPPSNPAVTNTVVSPGNPMAGHPMAGQPLIVNQQDLSNVTFIDGETRKSLKRMTSNAKTNTGKMMIPYAGLFMKAKMYAVFNGNRSDVRTQNQSPQFEVAIASDVKPADAIALVKLAINKDTRRIEIGRGGIFSSSSGTRKQDIVDVKIDELRTGPAGGASLYRITPAAALGRGEYAIALNGIVFYDFAID
jgi:hypothetical protein